MGKIVCCLCLFARKGLANEAVTIINGQAVCDDHVGYVQGDKFTLALTQLLKETKG